MIFLAVMMHVVAAREVPVWRVAISTFHVPLFFIVSGIVIGRAKDGWLAYLRKNAAVLLLPYLIWAAIYTPFKLENLPWILYGSWPVLNRIGTNTALWFLPAIFCGRVMYEAVMRLVERCPLPRLLAVPLAATLAFAVAGVMPNPAWGYPLGLHSGVIALGFILIGSVIYDFLLAAERQGRLRLLSCALVTTVLFAYGAFLRPGEHELVGVAEFKFGSRFWFFWNALFGCSAVLSVSVLFSTVSDEDPVLGRARRFMIWLGRNAIGVLILHVPVTRFLVTPCLQPCGIDRLSWHGAFVHAAVATAICCGLVCIVGKFLPALLAWLGIRRGAL